MVSRVSSNPSSSVEISPKWHDLFVMLPDYDPVATAAPGEWFDERAAQQAVDFFPECLQHIEGKFAGDPFYLEPWQQAVVGCLFGWKRENGTRRYREALLGIPRGNGKTPLAAGICIYALFCDDEPGAQIYGAAADVPQAALLFRHAKGMIRREPELDSRCKIHDSYKSVSLNADAASAYRVVSSDAPGKHGYAPHLVICDEIHAWQGRDLMEAFESAFAKAGRKQPLLLHITTRDYDRPSVCNDKWGHAEKVRDGIINDSAFLPIIFAAADGDDWTDEKTWEKVNPNIDVSVDRVSLRRMCERAQVEPSQENTFKRLHLNMRTSQRNVWPACEDWLNTDADVDDPVAWRDMQLQRLRGRRCVAGFDLSQTRDITALVLLFAEDDGGYTVLPWFWIPGDSADVAERRDRVQYAAWARQGFVSMTGGNSVDYDEIRATMNELAEDYDIAEVAGDPYNAMQLSHDLIADGFEVVHVRQAMVSMSPGTKELDRLAADHRIHHGQNPVLRWMASNVEIDEDKRENRMPRKASKNARIDGIAATVIALTRAMVQEDETIEPGVYAL